MIRKSAEEVRINPENHHEESGETSYTIKLGMNETHTISNEQRKEILEVLLTGSRQYENQKEDEENILKENMRGDEEGFKRLIMLVLGFGLGAFFFFLLSTL